MSHTAHVVMDPGRVSPSEALRELVTSTPLVCITGRAMAQLARELGGFEAATHHLAALANELERPIGINLPTVDDAIIASRDERHYLTTITTTRMLAASELEALDAPASGGNAP
jgi:hypothetical protein